MWSKFKWDMFVTSFIPLWLSIVIFDVWDIAYNAINEFPQEGNFAGRLLCFVKNNIIPLISVIVIFTVVITSINGISKFLKERECSKQNPSGTIKKVKKANKLSSEFLLAYILPLIAFDFSNLKSLALFVVYFAILAFLCIRNNNIYTNIFLEFKRYRIYLCDIERLVPGDNTVIYYDSLIISKDDLTLAEDKNIKYWDCDNYIYIHIKENIENE